MQSWAAACPYWREEAMRDNAGLSASGDKLPLDQAAILSASPGLRQVYETAPVGLAFLSTDCRYLMINQHLTEICGVSIADHIGRTVRETVPRVAEQVEQIVRHILLSGEPVTGIEINGQRPDGSNVERVWITYWHPLKSEQGEVVGINVAAEEITERKRAEVERTAMQKRLQQLNESLAERVEAQAQERARLWHLSQDLLVVTDATGAIASVNPAWTSTLGWAADELTGKPIDWLILPDDRDRLPASLASLEAGQPSPHIESRIRCKDGSYRWLSWRAILDRSSIYAIARDITNLKESQDKFHTMRTALAQVSRHETMDAMSASIAHEIRQPLSAIASNASASLRWLKRVDPDVAEAEAALDRIIRDSERANEVITSVRAMFEREQRERNAVNLGLLVDETLILTQRELEANRIATFNNVSGNLSAVRADRVQLQQVLVNLIMNSVDSMMAVADRERLLTFESSVVGQEVTLTVADTGTGIEPGKLDLIFEPFFTTKGQGMGLGLSICRSIIEAHDGRLSASLREPYGIALQMTLPLTMS
jgi:PAS domain S-box-containing protein